uniref:Uncharacterized protein n=1 Tax=Rhizophora mucronata TaxID=61149 RepID=A0A2P2QEF3_RHIMU
MRLVPRTYANEEKSNFKQDKWNKIIDAGQ